MVSYLSHIRIARQQSATRQEERRSSGVGPSISPRTFELRDVLAKPEQPQRLRCFRRQNYHTHKRRQDLLLVWTCERIARSALYQQNAYRNALYRESEAITRAGLQARRMGT